MWAESLEIMHTCFGDEISLNVSVAADQKELRAGQEPSCRNESDLTKESRTNLYTRLTSEKQRW